jgi:hypothetical protein
MGIFFKIIIFKQQFFFHNLKSTNPSGPITIIPSEVEMNFSLDLSSLEKNI